MRSSSTHPQAILLVAMGCFAGAGAVPPAAAAGLPAVQDTLGRFSPELVAGAEVVDVRVSPVVIELRVGEMLSLDRLEIVPVDADGARVEGVPLLTALQDRVAILREGVITAHAPGRAQLVVVVRSAPADPAGDPEVKVFRVPVVVYGEPVDDIRVEAPEHAFYEGTVVHLTAEARTAAGEVRDDVGFEWTSWDPAVATVTERGWVRALSPGRTTIEVGARGPAAEGGTGPPEATGTLEIEVRENPVRRIELTPSVTSARTGDVVRFEARPLDGSGREVEDIALTFTVSGGEERRALGASVYPDGAFVAAEPGVYRVVASAGAVSTEAVVEAGPRDIRRAVRQVGQGLISHHPSSDLWVFRGADGRDYAYVGTHAGGQTMYAWDVTDPQSPVLTDSVVVDARVVNDVKVNGDASLAVITREGASDRRNGIVLLDLADPAHPTVLSEFTENLTGGVHNTYIVGDLVYAIHDGDLDVHIIDVSDPRDPRHVGEWGIDRPGKYLHDIWIEDGLAYVSYWDDGVFVVDVGDGRWGGTPTEPVAVSSLAYPEGNTHVAFPYTNSDGHRYLFVGDEIFGCAECVARSGTHLDGPRGFIHVIDLEDPEELREVARYEVPEAGAHNVWLDDDILYVAYYQGGLRLVDVSGELRGDLYAQGREIAWFPTGHPDGLDPNAPQAWGPQPYRGSIFVSDLNSGLWVLRLDPGAEGAP